MDRALAGGDGNHVDEQGGSRASGMTGMGWGNCAIQVPVIHTHACNVMQNASLCLNFCPTSTTTRSTTMKTQSSEKKKVVSRKTPSHLGWSLRKTFGSQGGGG